MDVREAGARELPLDPGHEAEDGGLARADGPHGKPASRRPNRWLNARLAPPGTGIVEQVVGERVQHAVGEEAGVAATGRSSSIWSCCRSRRCEGPARAVQRQAGSKARASRVNASVDSKKASPNRSRR